MTKRTGLGLLALALMLLAAGCGEKMASTGPVDRNAPPDVLVRNAVEARASLTSMAGTGVMRIVDQPNRFGLTVNAEVIADESERLRIKADKLAGTIQAFDVVKLGDDIGFYIPTQKTLYHGKVGDLRNFSFRFDPDEVLRQMLRPETALLPRRWRYVQPQQGDPPGSIVLDDGASGGQPRQRLAIDSRNGMLIAVTTLDQAGQPYMVKRFDDYRPLTRGRKAPRGVGSPVFPYRIAFSWPREGRSMEMNFKGVEGNPVVTDGDFDVATSADTRYRPLQEASMESEGPAVAQPRAPARRNM